MKIIQQLKHSKDIITLLDNELVKFMNRQLGSYNVYNMEMPLWIFEDDIKAFSSLK